jgi:exopolysaccharide biosynthesis protein
VHRGEAVDWFTAVSGSAQIVTAGRKTIPSYGGGGLTPGGPNAYSNADSWYERLNARTVIGLSRDARRLVLFTVDRAGGSLGMTVGEAAEFLIAHYGVWEALNLDGGGSTSLAVQGRGLLNVPSEGGSGRALGSSLAIFAGPK